MRLYRKSFVDPRPERDRPFRDDPSRILECASQKRSRPAPLHGDHEYCIQRGLYAGGRDLALARSVQCTATLKASGLISVLSRRVLSIEGGHDLISGSAQVFAKSCY